MSNFWDIYAYTASTPAYADLVVKFIDPEGQYILGILHRNNCMETRNGFFIKDLRVAKNRDWKKSLIVDNLSHSFAFHISHGVPILEWHNDRNDCELRYLMDYLVEAAQSDDVVKFNENRMKLRQFVNNYNEN